MYGLGIYLNIYRTHPMMIRIRHTNCHVPGGAGSVGGGSRGRRDGLADPDPLGGDQHQTSEWERGEDNIAYAVKIIVNTSYVLRKLTLYTATY